MGTDYLHSFICNCCCLDSSSNSDGRRYDCSICKKQFQYKKCYLNHYRKKHLRFKKTDCGDESKDMHLTTKSDGTKGDDTKSDGTKDDGTKGDGTKSEDAHTCNVCGKCFTNRRSFLRHNRETHSELKKPKVKKKWDTRVVKCPHCNEKILKWTRHHHLEQVHNIQPPTCGVCGKKFPCQSSVLYHTRKVHMKEKNFFCKTCGLGFFRNQHLLQHERSHSSERPFACDVCGKGFRWKPNLISHVMIHTKEKKKKCAVCGERFVQKASLNYHMTKHHPEVPF